MAGKVTALSVVKITAIRENAPLLIKISVPSLDATFVPLLSITAPLLTGSFRNNRPLCSPPYNSWRLCPSLFSETSQIFSFGDSTLSVQVADDSNVIIPVHFSSSSIHLSSVLKFKFPIRPPEPNRIQDKRSTLNIFQDMIGILNDTQN